MSIGNTSQYGFDDTTHSVDEAISFCFKTLVIEPFFFNKYM
jgi:hypothetical protein